MVGLTGRDSQRARERGARGRWVCALAVAASVLLLPAAAQAGVGASAVPSFPTTVTVGDTGVPATIQLGNANDAPDTAATNYVCNATTGGACSGPGITLIASCGALGDFSACVTPDPGVFRISPTATGVAGTGCAGMSFAVAPFEPSGRVRFTPVGGQRVTLAGAGTRCRIAFTFDVLRAPSVDQSAAAGGLQTAQVADNTQQLEATGLTASARGSSAGLTVLRARPAIATQASESVEVGGRLTDTAVVTGRVNPVAGATVDFRLYGPGDANCTEPPVFQSLGRPVGADGRAVSEPYTTTAAGTHHWVASYSGDANNEPVSGACNDADENVVVTARPPRITTGDVPGSGGGRCTESNFTLRVNARAAGLRGVKVTLDGKTIATSKRAKFKVRVKAKARKFGRHVIRIVARGAGGRTVRVLEFRRCGRPQQPRFVG